MFLELIPAAHAAEASAVQASDAGVLGSLGINLKLFVAQLINFSIVFFVLWRWVITPLVKTMNARQKTIEESLEKAKKIEVQMADSETAYAHKLAEAHAAARALIQEADAKAQTASAQIKERAKEEIARTLAEARTALTQEQAHMVADAKRAISELVVAGAEKLLREKLTDAKDRALTAKMIEK